jgi:hypothetical protein
MARVLFLTLLAVMASTAVAVACPEGFTACGETNQLCCPAP